MSKELSTRFVPLYGVALINLYPEDGGDLRNSKADPREFTYEYDEETRMVKYEHGEVGTLPKDFDCCIVNTDEPINIYEWFVGRPKDIAELKKAAKAYRSARDRLMKLLGNE
jgi:hypothetical protein